MPTTQQFTVKGMTCGNCVRHVEKALERLAGVSSVSVDLDAAQATVAYDPSVVTVDAMTATVAEAGYTMEVKS